MSPVSEKSGNLDMDIEWQPCILILAGNEVMHESLDQFKFRPDTTTNSRVICLCASEKMMYNVVNTLAPLFFISDEFEI